MHALFKRFFVLKFKLSEILKLNNCVTHKLIVDLRLRDCGVTAFVLLLEIGLKDSKMAYKKVNCKHTIN